MTTTVRQSSRSFMGLYSTPLRRSNLKRIRRSSEMVVDVRSMSKVERYTLLGIIITMYLMALSVFISILHMSLAYSAADDATVNSMVQIISSGVFDSRAGLNSTATNIFLKISQAIFAVALPFMSTFAITMTTIALISSVIYLTQPELFEEVDQAHQERSGNTGVKGLIDFGRNAGFRKFILSICPNFKRYAFSDAVQAGPDGLPTMQDFLKNIPKYIMIFAFCITINNRTMLDFIMKGAEVGAVVFEKITYDFDYANSVVSWLDEGSDYKPASFNTKQKTGANKMQVYKRIYNLLKTRITNADDKTSDAKAIMGSKLENMINSEKFAGVNWDRDVCTVSVAYSGSPQTSSVDGTYTVPVGEFLPYDNGVIYVTINTENTVKYNSTYSVTTYESCWEIGGSGLPVSFDFSKMNEIATKFTNPSGFNINNVIYTVTYIDAASGDEKHSQAEVALDSSGKASIQVPSGVDSKNISAISIKLKSTTGGVKFTTTSSTTVTHDVVPHDAISWSNPAFSPSLSKATN